MMRMQPVDASVTGPVPRPRYALGDLGGVLP